MTSITGRRELLTVWRRRLFYLWVGAAIIAGFAAMLAGPIVISDGSDGTTWVALISPAAMAVFVISGIAWLALLVASHRSKYLHQPPD
ncbi:MAG: hypothetical protein KJ587_02910 [Alphaproteobacteria bacterium]|nr:hypothetical protein [Alphaproteobacteria bacterium]